MSEKVSKRVKAIQPSTTLSIDAKAKELKARGVDIINLSVGEPDFDTPDFIKKVAIQQIQRGFTKYTPFDGITELKEAIINKFQRDNYLSFNRDQIMVSTGLKQCLYNLAQAILDEGDEVIIPAPYWVSYPAMVKLAGAKPVLVQTNPKNRLKITPDQLEEAITPDTRLLILNSPSNPSGIAYKAEELAALGEVLEKYSNVIIASDDIYEYILSGIDHYVNILNVCPGLKNRTVVGNGMSKAYAMTGWRIGYIAAPEFIINGMKKIQSQSTGCANSIAQKASVAALNAGRDFFRPMNEKFKMRHELVLKMLKRIDGVDCLTPDGTFYVFPNVKAALLKKGIQDDLELAEILLEKVNVAIVPGTAFGMPGYIRISCATSEENLEIAMNKIASVLS